MSSRLPELRNPPPALPEMPLHEKIMFEKSLLLPGEIGPRPLYHPSFDEPQGQAPVYQAAAAFPAPVYQAAAAYQAPVYQAAAAFPAFQAPKTMAEIEVRKKQHIFKDLEGQLSRKEITPDVFEKEVALLNLSQDEMDEAGLFLLNQEGGKRKSRYSKTNKRRRSRSNKRSKSRSHKRQRHRSNKRSRK